jgi:hypothetical protein
VSRNYSTIFDPFFLAIKMIKMNTAPYLRDYGGQDDRNNLGFYKDTALAARTMLIG